MLAMHWILLGVDPSPISETDNFNEHQVGGVTTYQSALVAALDDEIITEDEWAMWRS